MYIELVISLIILIGIFTLDYISQKYTDSVINEATVKLKEIIDKIQKNEVNNEEILKEAEEKYENWLKHHEKLAYFIEHDELEKVETNYISGKSFLKMGKYEDALSEFEKTIFVLEHINDKYSINLRNIF